MPKISVAQKGLLTRGVELILNFSDPAARTIQLVKTGDVDDGGVTLQAIYARLVDLWRTESDLPPIPFPFEQITEEKFDLKNSWNWADATTRQLIRDGGWSVRDSNNALLEEWPNVTTLGAIGSTDQVYYQQQAGGATTNFVLTGAVNQAIQTFKSGAGAFGYRGYLKLFVRRQGKTYSSASLLDIGITTIDYRKNSFPLSNATDIKITDPDATIDTTAPYTGMSITYYASPQSRTIGGTSYQFDVIVNGNNGTAEQIYSFVQRQLRRNADIDAGAGTVNGTTADSLMSFPGSGTTLLTTTGVFIDNYQAGDINRIIFTDRTGVQRTFPYTAAGTINFNNIIQGDSNAKYYLFFSNPTATTGDEYGTSGAILVNDASGNPITGNVSGAASISFTFAYDSNVQGGRTAGTDAAVVAVVLGGSVNGAQFASSTGTIARSTTNVISVSAALDRVYA